jgi:hypothetical protein
MEHSLFTENPSRWGPLCLFDERGVAGTELSV